MSVLSTIGEAVGITPAPKAPASVEKISQQIADAKAKIVQLQEDHARECLRWADTGDATERDRLADQLAAARVDLASLQSALSMANRRNSQLERERLAGLNASRLQSMTIHLRALEKASAEASAAIEKLAQARRKMHAAATKARASAPSPLPRGSLTEASTLDALIAHEFHRLSHDPGAPGKPGTGALPGSKPPSLLVKDDPAAIPALSDQLRQAHDFAIGVVRGAISADRAAPIAAQVAPDAPKLDAVADAVSPEPPGEFNAADLLPGTHSAAELMAANSRRVKLS